MATHVTVNAGQGSTQVTVITGEGSTSYSVSAGARGPAGPAGSGSGVTVDPTIIDGSENAVAGNAVFDALALKAPLASPTFTGTVTAPHIHGSIAGNLYVHVRNTSGGTLTKGTPIYITGNVGTAGNEDRVTVAAADNTNPAKMPAVALLGSDLANNGDGNGIIVGELMNLNIPSYSINQELYVGAGVIATTKPTTGEVQSVGVVSRINTNTGIIVVNMQGRRDAATTTATANTLVLRDGTGGANFADLSASAVSVTATGENDAVTAISTLGTAIKGTATSGDGVYGYGANGVYGEGSMNGVSGYGIFAGVDGYSNDGVGVFASSTNGYALSVTTTAGTNHAKFGETGIDQSFVARVKGAFGWIRGSFTGRIHPPDTLTADRTYTLPDKSGTVAMVDAETHTGAHAFSSTTRPTSSGTGTPEATSLITTADGDARYGDYVASSLSADGAAIQSQTTLQNTGCVLTLGVGVWLINAQIHITNANTLAAGKFAGTISGGTEAFGNVMWQVANTGVPNHDNQNWFSATRTIVAGNRGWWRAEGIIRVASGTITVRTQYAQNVSTAADTIVKSGTFLQARRL